MQDIAEEFALPFNIKAVKQKISGVPPNKHVYFHELTPILFINYSNDHLLIMCAIIHL